MNIYYKVIEVWCKYPFHTEIDYRYCVFSISKKSFDKKKFSFIYDSNTTIKEKEEFIKDKLKIKKVNIIKLK